MLLCATRQWASNLFSKHFQSTRKAAAARKAHPAVKALHNTAQAQGSRATEASFDVRPTNPHAAILADEGEQVYEVFRWGFKPEWAHMTLINFRANKLTGC